MKNSNLSLLTLGCLISLSAMISCSDHSEKGSTEGAPAQGQQQEDMTAASYVNRSEIAQKIGAKSNSDEDVKSAIITKVETIRTRKENKINLQLEFKNFSSLNNDDLTLLANKILILEDATHLNKFTEIRLDSTQDKLLETKKGILYIQKDVSLELFKHAIQNAHLTDGELKKEKIQKLEDDLKARLQHKDGDVFYFSNTKGGDYRVYHFVLEVLAQFINENQQQFENLSHLGPNYYFENKTFYSGDRLTLNTSLTTSAQEITQYLNRSPELIAKKSQIDAIIESLKNKIEIQVVLNTSDIDSSHTVVNHIQTLLQTENAALSKVDIIIINDEFYYSRNLSKKLELSLIAQPNKVQESLDILNDIETLTSLTVKDTLLAHLQSAAQRLEVKTIEFQHLGNYNVLTIRNGIKIIEAFLQKFPAYKTSVEGWIMIEGKVSFAKNELTKAVKAKELKVSTEDFSLNPDNKIAFIPNETVLEKMIQFFSNKTE